jgi:hypothetical protein
MFSTIGTRSSDGAGAPCVFTIGTIPVLIVVNKNAERKDLLLEVSERVDIRLATRRRAKRVSILAGDILGTSPGRGVSLVGIVPSFGIHWVRIKDNSENFILRLSLIRLRISFCDSDTWVGWLLRFGPPVSD